MVLARHKTASTVGFVLGHGLRNTFEAAVNLCLKAQPAILT